MDEFANHDQLVDEQKLQHPEEQQVLNEMVQDQEQVKQHEVG
jgi:hypothetical protein